MRCPHCSSLDDKVIESRSLARGDCIRRRRACISCNYRFTSYERVEEKPLLVIKKDGRREPFDRAKLSKGMLRAVEKRPIPSTKIDNILTEIEDKAAIQGKGSQEIASTVIGEMVLTELHKLDKVAYIRFASVYKDFNNLDEFINEVKKVGDLNENN